MEYFKPMQPLVRSFVWMITCRFHTAARQTIIGWIVCLMASGLGFAEVDDPVDQRIRTHRTAEVELQIKDSEGRPITGEPVTIEMTGHQFLFGCNLFLLDRCGDEKTNRLYADRFAALFNFATLPFYWGMYEPEEARTEEARLRHMAEWCRSRGIRAKGHTLCYFLVEPAWLANKPLDEIERLQAERVKREVSTFTGLIDTWDVANEVVFMPTHHGGKSPIARLSLALGREGLVKRVFGEAVAGNPEACLLLNDWVPDDRYLKLIEQSEAAGARIDAVGLQSHMHDGYFGTDWLWRTCERFRPLKKPVHFTELTILSSLEKRQGEHTDWLTTPEGEEQQVKQVVETYRWLFSHPSVEAITWWDFADLNSWRGAPAGLLRKDMSPKPAYQALLKLIRSDWWTPRQELHPDAGGRVRFTGFLGDYAVTAGGQKGAFVVSKPGKQMLEATLSGH